MLVCIAAIVHHVERTSEIGCHNIRFFTTQLLWPKEFSIMLLAQHLKKI